MKTTRKQKMETTLADLVEQLQSLSHELTFAEIEDFNSGELMLKASDEVGYIASKLDELLVQLDIAEKEWGDYVLTTIGDGAVNKDDDSKNTYEQVYNEHVQYWEENNFPGDEQSSPNNYTEKHGK